MNSFIVEFWSRVFEKLSYISTFTIVRAAFPKAARTYGFVDAWVLAHLFLSVASVFVVAFDDFWWISFLLVMYGSVRVVEITVYQINVLLFDEYRARKQKAEYSVRGYRRLVLLLLHNYFEIVFWFSCSYIFFAESFIYKWSGGYRNAPGAVYSSFIAMSTFGEFNLTPKDVFGAIIIFLQSICGLFMTLLSLARFISLLPSPATMDEFEVGRLPKK